MALYREFETAEDISKAYDVEQSVPDFMVYAEQFVRDSEKTRNALDCHLGVHFGPTVDETVDIFPAADPNAPIVVFIHGGYWKILSSLEFSFAAAAAVPHGYTVVVTNYSLCPKVSMSEITRQSRAALAWLYRTDFAFNGDRNRIYVSGHSAGGQQTAMLISTDWAGDYGLPADLIKGGIMISGLFDLSPLRYSFAQPQLQLNADIIQRESPMFHLPESAPPMLVSVGADEPPEFVRQSKAYYEALRDRGLNVLYDEQPGKNHFTAIDGFLDQQSRLFQQISQIVEG